MLCSRSKNFTIAQSVNVTVSAGERKALKNSTVAFDCVFRSLSTNFARYESDQGYHLYHLRGSFDAFSFSIIFFLCVALLLSSALSHANDWPQWRGPNRDGISTEKGLLKEWPKDGPKLNWQIKQLGSGFSTPSVVGGRIYVLGNTGLENEFVEALSERDGKKVWSTTLGKVGNPDQQPSYPAARSTPTVEGDTLFAL